VIKTLLISLGIFGALAAAVAAEVLMIHVTFTLWKGAGLLGFVGVTAFIVIVCAVHAHRTSKAPTKD
jgi:hypothetical protein